MVRNVPLMQDVDGGVGGCACVAVVGIWEPETALKIKPIKIYTHEIQIQTP